MKIDKDELPTVENNMKSGVTGLGHGWSQVSHPDHVVFSEGWVPNRQVVDVKTNIEFVHRADVYHALQLMLIHQGKVLKDNTTVEENKVAENSFVDIMFAKNKSSYAKGSTTSSTMTTKTPPASAPPSTKATQAPEVISALPASSPSPVPVEAPEYSVTSVSESNVYGQAASNLVASGNIDGAVQQILDMGGGIWDRVTVLCALRAAYKNPERATDYLYSGIPEHAEVPPVAQAPFGGLSPNFSARPQQPVQPATVSSSGPNANPLDIFPRGLPNIGPNVARAGNLDFIRNSLQFQVLRTMVQANPQILQPMLQEPEKQNPHLMRLIQEHQADFIRMINEPVEGGEGANMLEDLTEAVPQAVEVTPEEHEAIEQLEAKGFSNEDIGTFPFHWKCICEFGEKINAMSHCNRKVTGAAGDYLKEASDINRSLSELGHSINSDHVACNKGTIGEPRPNTSAQSIMIRAMEDFYGFVYFAILTPCLGGVLWGAQFWKEVIQLYYHITGFYSWNPTQDSPDKVTWEDRSLVMQHTLDFVST